MKKVLAASIGAMVLLSGGIYGIHSVFAADDQGQEAVAKVSGASFGKRAEKLSAYQEQIHELNRLREERLDLRKQAIEKRDSLVDLIIDAKNGDTQVDRQQAKAIKEQLQELNQQLKPLLEERKDERKALREAVKAGEGSDQFTKLIETQQQVNAKIKEKLTDLDKLLDLFN